MLLLTSTSDAIKVVTGQAVTVDVHASWVDIDGSGNVTFGRQDTLIVTATTTIVVPSPGSGVTRNVKILVARNRHASSSCDTTVQHSDGTNTVTLMHSNLAADQVLQYADEAGFEAPSVFATPFAVAYGGTGLTGGTSGGVPYYAGPSTIASSAVLAANQLVLGGGAGAAPATLGSLGTTATVLHGNAVGAPSFGAVSLTTDVVGTLPAGNGGTGQSSYAVGDLLYASGATALSRLADVATGQVLVSGGVGVAPAYSATPTVQTLTTTGLLTAGNGLTVSAGAVSVPAGSLANAALTNSSITLNAGAGFGVTTPGAMSLGSTYTIGTTSDALHVLSVELGTASSSTGSVILDNVTSAFKLTLQSASVATASRLVTFPDPGGADSVAYLALSQTLTNKTISGASNTLSNIGNSSLTNSSITVSGTTNQVLPVGPTPVALGGSITLSLPQSIHTAATPQFGALGLGVAAGATAGTYAATLAANNATALLIKRFTDTLPTGKFLDFQSAAAASLFTVDITGTVTSGTWQGMAIAASYLNANVVQAVTNDTNVTGSIAAQTLTLGWMGTLAAARLNANVVQAVGSGTNVTGSIAAQTLTLGWTGTLAIGSGGTGQSTASAAFNALSPMTTLGDLIYGGTAGAGTRLAGNATSSQQFLAQTGTGVVSAAPAWHTLVTADLTDLTTAATGITKVGTVTTGVWNASTVTVPYGGTGLALLTQGYIPFGQGTAALGSSANLFWDATNGNLGLGTTAPAISLGSLGIARGLDIISPLSANSAAVLTLAQVGTTDGYNLGLIIFGSTGCAAADKRSAMIQSVAVGSQVTNPMGTLAFWTANGGTITQKMYIGPAGGLVVGSATGGDKGAGTVNVASGIYLNGTAYTFPDYVFERWATGRITRYALNRGAAVYAGLRPLDEVERYVCEHWSLPLMDRHRDGDLFERGDLLMASVEESYLYLFGHERRIVKLEAKVARLRAQLAGREN